MPIVWTESLTLRLVTLYSQHECLRNPYHPNYKNKLCRYKAYKEIVDCMNVCGLTVCDCIKRITYIKAQYCYELSKISAAISCEKYYKPTACWFPSIHKLFFPLVASYTCANDICKISDGETDSLNDYDCNETRPDYVDLRTLIRDCDCPYTTKTNPRARRKTPYTQTEGDTFIGAPRTATDGTNCSARPPRKVTRISVGNNTRRNINEEYATQTDVSYFKTACRTCQINAANDMSIKSTNCATSMMKTDLRNAGCIDCFLPEEDMNVKKKAHDEFDMFGKSIAFQLRNINFEIAIKLEKRIQNLIAQERLDNVKLKGSDCSSACRCSQCIISQGDMVCSCGLPVIMIKADSSCDFECKRGA